MHKQFTCLGVPSRAFCNNTSPPEVSWAEMFWCWGHLSPRKWIMIGLPVFHTNNVRSILVCNWCYSPATEINLSQMTRLWIFPVFASLGLYSIYSLCLKKYSRIVDCSNAPSTFEFFLDNICLLHRKWCNYWNISFTQTLLVFIPTMAIVTHVLPIMGTLDKNQVSCQACFVVVCLFVWAVPRFLEGALVWWFLTVPFPHPLEWIPISQSPP